MAKKKPDYSSVYQPDENKEFLQRNQDECSDFSDSELRPKISKHGSQNYFQKQSKMNSTSVSKSKTNSKNFALAVLTLSYVVGELGRFLIGVTTKEMAIDLHYGDITCQFNSTTLSVIDLPIQCDTANSSETCESLELNGTRYCEWNYDGFGLDYQILAGPSYMAVFTIGGVILGIAADRFNRVHLLAMCTLVFGIGFILTGAVTEYWQLFMFRMLAAAGEAGCNPLAAGILSDLYTEEKRGLAMSIFNWGIFGGYGSAFPIGRYISQLNIWGTGWRMCYYGSGVVGLVVAILIATTLTEPERKIIGEEKQRGGKQQSLSEVLFQPRMILLCIASCIRNSGGYCLAVNCDLYYRKYFPDYNLSWWLFIVTIVIGSFGVLVGGAVSDKFVAKMGVKSRVFILGLSQILASPFSFGSVYFNPALAMACLAVSYFFAEMWLGILYAVLVEIVPLKVRSKTIGIFLFVINNFAGFLVLPVEPISKAYGYRESLYIFYTGFYFTSSILFFITVLLMGGPNSKLKNSTLHTEKVVKISMSDISNIPTVRSSNNDKSQL